LFPRLCAAVAARGGVDVLAAGADDWRPDVVVHEQAELAAPAVAARLGVPNVCHSFGSPIPLEILEEAAARLGPVWGRVGRPVAPLGGCFDHLYVDIFPPSLSPGPLPHLGRRVRRRPASLDAAPGDRLPPAIDGLVRSGGAIGYVTFGTTFNVNDTFAAAVAAVARFDAGIIVTVGPAGDVDAFGPQPPNVHIHQYLPQSLVLPHATFVVSHGGSGTMLAALASGVPQLCLPQAADQFRNGEAVARAGAGLTLTPAAATEETITDAVRRLQSEASFAVAAERMAAEIAAMPGPAAIVPEIEDLVFRPG
jgi:UDP:flavonoid glycosyltransferase YjiC (YdhE family)